METVLRKGISPAVSIPKHDYKKTTLELWFSNF
jgi:hypothetical protein